MAEGESRTARDSKSDRKCKECRMEFGDIYDYTDHLESKLHVKNIMKNKYGKKYLEAKELLEERLSSKSHESHEYDNVEDKTSIDENSDSSEDEVYTCDACEKICTGKTSYNLHMKGSKHKKKLKQIKTMKELKNKQIIPNGYVAPDENLLSELTPKNIFASSDLMCPICSVKCTGPDVFHQHIKGEAHRKKEAQLDLKMKMEAEGMPTNSSKEDFVDTYSCDDCHKVFTGIVPYDQHIKSNTHLKQVIRNQSLEKIKGICINTSSDSKFRCPECGKCFSGPIPYNAHLRSAAHEKLKKKYDLYEKLEKKYSEMVKVSIRNDSEDDDSDSETMVPACPVCNSIFSGPEAAKDHFESEKHRKALKKKKKINKIKGIIKTEAVVKHSSINNECKGKQNGGHNNGGEYDSDDSFETVSP